MKPSRVTTPGRPLKGGERRKSVMVKLPPLLADQLFAEAERRGVPITDLGAVFLLGGWNAARTSSGVDPFPTPAYLAESGLQTNRVSVEIQEPLLAS